LPPPLLSFLQAADAGGGGGGVLAAVLSGIQVIERGKCAYECCWHAGRPWLLAAATLRKSKKPRGDAAEHPRPRALFEYGHNHLREKAFCSESEKSFTLLILLDACIYLSFVCHKKTQSVQQLRLFLWEFSL